MPHKTLSGATILTMAIACGLAVASLYYIQPLLHTVASELGLTATQAGNLMTYAQVGYAIGLLLIVPLGDLLERRRFIICMMLLAAASLLSVAFAPNYGLLASALALTGLVSVVAQVLVPFAATLAPPSTRGKVVGTVMSGLLMGILLARTVSGLLAEAGSWRTVFWVAAIALVLITLALAKRLPPTPPTLKLSYPRLIGSIFTLFHTQPILRSCALLGACVFAMMSMLWTALTFLLSGPDFGYGDATIGLFGLIGAAGALAANVVGKLADRGQSQNTTTLALILLLTSWIALYFAPHTLTLLIVGILVLDMAVQGVQISNQVLIYQLNPEAKSRITAGYMTCFFIGGALGSTCAAWLYEHYGWGAICTLGMLVATFALAYYHAVALKRIRLGMH